MAIQYTTTGGLSIFGCAHIKHSIYYNYKYKENSIVFLRYKAIHGILEKIAIKKVIIRSNIKTHGKVIIFYQDTLNGYFNEEELCTYEEAIDLIKDFYEKLRILTQKAIKNCIID